MRARATAAEAGARIERWSRAVQISAAVGATAILALATVGVYDLGFRSGPRTLTVARSRPAPRVTATVDPSALPMSPGGTEASVFLTVVNMSTRDNLRYVSIVGTVDPASLPSGCDAGWFQFVYAGNGAIVPRGSYVNDLGYLYFYEADVDQSACIGAAPRIRVSVR